MTENNKPSIDAAAAVAAADRMTDAVNGLGTRFDTLSKDTKTETSFLRKVIKIVAVSVLFDICLSVGAFGLGWRINHVADQAKAATSVARQVTTAEAAAHNAAVVSCNSGNDFRRADAARWQGLVSNIPTPTTPAAIAAQANALAIILAPDVLRDCSKIK